MTNLSSAKYIEILQLTPHPEGGFYKEIFASPNTINAEALPGIYSGPRKIYTSIYFLLESGDVSKFHRLQSDELWYFHAGNLLTIHILEADGTNRTIKLGPDIDDSHAFQARVPAGCWFGATVDQPNTFALVGCMVAPGFDFADFEMAEREQLVKDYPNYRNLIEKLT